MRCFLPGSYGRREHWILMFRQAGHALWCLPWCIFQRSGTRSSRYQRGLCRYTGCGTARLYQHDGSFYRYHCDLFSDGACHSIQRYAGTEGCAGGVFERNSAYDRCIFHHIWQGGGMDAYDLYRIVCVCYNYCMGISGRESF